MVIDHTISHFQRYQRIQRLLSSGFEHIVLREVDFDVIRSGFVVKNSILLRGALKLLATSFLFERDPDQMVRLPFTKGFRHPVELRFDTV